MLRAAPVTLPCALAIGVVAWWAADGGGFAISRWGPGGLLLIGTLLVALVSIPNDWRAVPRSVAVAAAAMGAFTVWSFASVAWADDPGAAWEGASRTLLYAVVFALFALWPQRERSATALLTGWLAALGLVAVVTAVRLVSDDDIAGLFRALRLTSPTGYYNATAALFLMPLLPAVCVAAGARAPWWARGACAGLAVLFGALGLLCVSRGAAVTLPVATIVMLALTPIRVRLVLTLVPVGLGLATLAPGLLDVGEALQAGTAAEELQSILGRTAVVAGVVAVVVGATVALLERATEEPRTAARLALGGRVVAAIVALVVVAGAVVAAGDPVERADTAWASFKGGYADNAQDTNRLLGGLGSGRYDFYRVGLDVFTDRPVAGIGADGFFQPYLRDGRSGETPRYPHSWELRTLAQTGLVGAVLLLTAIGAALVASWRAMRTGGPGAAAVAGGSAAASVYWLAHGSVDWFWEWAGLGVPAFALLGLACSLAPRTAPTSPRAPVARSRRTAFAVLGCASLAVPVLSVWVASSQERAAARSFVGGDVTSAYEHVRRASRINPFSAAPANLEGSIALRRGDIARADAAFGAALERVPADQYATLERGAVASVRGDRRRALALLRRAVALAPRDPLAREALAIVRRGDVIDIVELNRRILVGAGVTDG